MVLLWLLLVGQPQTLGLVFENSDQAHFSNSSEGVTLRQGPGWLRLPDVMLDYELTFEYRLDDPKADAGVVVRSWARPRSWPEGGYRIRLPATGGDFKQGLLFGHRAEVETVRAPTPLAPEPADGWRRIHISAERQRISVTVDGVDAGEYQIGSVAGRVMFDAKKGVVRLRNISVKDLESDSSRQAPPAGTVPPGIGGVTMPEVIYEEKPQYTREAMRRRVEGIVELQAVVLPDGRVGQTRVVKPLDPDLDRAAQAAARMWRFKPGSKGGTNVPVLVVIEMTFALTRK